MLGLKVWGKIFTIFKNEKCKIDYLYVEKDSCCSIHKHSFKKNIFFLISGDIRIITDFGEHKLEKAKPFDVASGITHQFKALKNSFMLEIAYVEKGKLKEEDINRKIQGGKFIKGKFYTLNELKGNNWEK